MVSQDITIDTRVQNALKEHPSIADAIRSLCDGGHSINRVADSLTALGHPAVVRDFLGISQIVVDGVDNPICWMQSRSFQRSSFRSTPSFSISDDSFDIEREAHELRGYVDPYGW